MATYSYTGAEPKCFKIQYKMIDPNAIDLTAIVNVNDNITGDNDFSSSDFIKVGNYTTFDGDSSPLSTTGYVKLENNDTIGLKIKINSISTKSSIESGSYFQISTTNIDISDCISKDFYISSNSWKLYSNRCD